MFEFLDTPLSVPHAVDLAAIGCLASLCLLMLGALFSKSGLSLSVEFTLHFMPLLTLHELLRLDLAIQDTSDESCVLLSLNSLLRLGKMAKDGIARRGHLEVGSFALTPVIIILTCGVKSHLIL